MQRLLRGKVGRVSWLSSQSSVWAKVEGWSHPWAGFVVALCREDQEFHHNLWQGSTSAAWLVFSDFAYLVWSSRGWQEPWLLLLMLELSVLVPSSQDVIRIFRCRVWTNSTQRTRVADAVLWQHATVCSEPFDIRPIEPVYHVAEPCFLCTGENLPISVSAGSDALDGAILRLAWAVPHVDAQPFPRKRTRLLAPS